MILIKNGRLPLVIKTQNVINKIFEIYYNAFSLPPAVATKRKSIHSLAFEHYLRTGEHLTPGEWLARYERKFNPYHDPANGQFTSGPGGAGLTKLKSLPVLASNEHLLLPMDIEPAEWKVVHNRAFGQYLRTGRLMSMAEGLAEVEWKFNPYHDERGRFTFAPGNGRDNHEIVVYGRKPGSGPASGKNWKTKDASVKIPEKIRSKVDGIAKDYNATTGKALTVTDGSRTPRDQAERMLYKYNQGDFSNYKGLQGAKIADIYRQGIANGKSISDILDNMTSAIDRNFQNGNAISKHLYNRVVDFSVCGMTTGNKAVIRDAIRQNGGIPLPEVIPPHIHASF